jgi:hypothetical protein
MFENKLFLFLVWRVELGLEVRDYTLSQSISHFFFVLGVFEIGSYILFAQPQSSLSLPPESQGLQS